MKKIFILFLFLLSFCSYSQQKVALNGTVSGLGSHKLALIYKSPEKKVLDTIALDNNQFKISIPIAESQEIAIFPYQYYENSVESSSPGKYFLAPMLIVFIAPGDTIEIHGDARALWEAQVKGGRFEEEYTAFRKEVTRLHSLKHELLLQQYSTESKKDSVAFSSFRAQRFSVRDSIKQKEKQFFINNTDSYYAMYKLSDNLKNIPTSEIQEIFNSYNKDLRNSALGQSIQKFIDESVRVDVGSRMIDFSGVTLDGARFNSKDLRGKYTLLDFWGSWCGPCRKSNPYLKDIYMDFKDKGFEIVGIAQEGRSLEKSIMSWEKAVKEDGLNWIQLLNEQLKEEKDLVKAYRISAFPTKILIDDKGIIIWKESGGDTEALRKKLEEIL